MIYLILFFLQFGFAADYLSLELEASSEYKEPAKAKQDILNSLVKRVSFENIEGIIGKEESQKKAKEIKAKILPKYGIYIPYITQGNLDRSSLPWSMKVTMQFSREALRSILLKEGLLNFTSENVKILPFVSFLDKKYSKSYKWWFVDNNYKETLVYEQAMIFQNLLKEKMWQESFHVMNPIEGEFHRFIPEDIRNVTYSTSELKRIGKSLNAQMILYGSVHYGPAPTNALALKFDLELEAILVGNGRRVASIEKSFETKAGEYKEKLMEHSREFYEESVEELKSSIMDTWQKGLFDTDRVRIKVYGDMNYKELETFKDFLKKKSLKIKNLVGRSYGPGHIILEADVSKGANALIEDLKTLEWKGKKLRSWKSNDNEIRVEI